MYGPLPHPVPEREHELHRPHQVRRQARQQQPPFAQGLAHQPEVEHLEVAQAAVDQLARPARRAERRGRPPRPAPTDSPRDAASSAMPTPVIPPPTTSTSSRSRGEPGDRRRTALPGLRAPSLTPLPRPRAPSSASAQRARSRARPPSSRRGHDPPRDGGAPAGPRPAPGCLRRRARRSRGRSPPGRPPPRATSPDRSATACSSPSCAARPPPTRSTSAVPPHRGLERVGDLVGDAGQGRRRQVGRCRRAARTEHRDPVRAVPVRRAQARRRRARPSDAGRPSPALRRCCRRAQAPGPRACPARCRRSRRTPPARR